MTQDRWITGEYELNETLRAMYAAPQDGSYWDGLEARILTHIARGGTPAVWYGELVDLMRPGLIAAAGLIAFASLALLQSRRAEARSAYATVISPAAISIEPATRAASIGDGDAAMHFILSH